MDEFKDDRGREGHSRFWFKVVHQLFYLREIRAAGWIVSLVFWVVFSFLSKLGATIELVALHWE